MFIKILTPNHNGKIELTVRDLEALIQEAVDKAITEDRANRPYQFWYDNGGGINRINTTPNWDWKEITYNGNNITPLNLSGDNKTNDTASSGITLVNAISEMIGEQTR